LAWINATCPPKPLYHSPSSAGQGRGNMMKREGEGENNLSSIKSE